MQILGTGLGILCLRTHSATEQSATCDFCVAWIHVHGLLQSVAKNKLLLQMQGQRLGPGSKLGRDIERRREATPGNGSLTLSPPHLCHPGRVYLCCQC